jgi:UDP-xylose/UDP-N-acetylglucosamine transporter B4
VDKEDSLAGDIPVEHEEDPFEFFHWLIGISMLTFALFLSAQMGIYQEIIYKRHGKHPQEALFYSVR